MAAIARRLHGAARDLIRRFVAAHAEALEPGLKVLETSLGIGRSTIDVVALDAQQRLVLIAASETADAEMLISSLDAYFWCLAFPDDLRRLYPSAQIAAALPPRVVFIAEHIPDSFLELVERQSVVHVECQELSESLPVEHAGVGAAVDPRAAGATGVMPTWPGIAVVAVAASAEPPAIATASPGSEPEPAPALVVEPPVLVAAGFDAAVAREWETFLGQAASGEAGGGCEPADAPVTLIEPVTPTPMPNGQVPNGPMPDGDARDRHAAEGHATNRHDADTPAVGGAPSDRRAAGHASQADVFTQAAWTAEPIIEPATVNLSVRPLSQPAPAPASATPAHPAPARGQDDRRITRHPALESLRFPRSGVSREWQEFLDRLATQ